MIALPLWSRYTTIITFKKIRMIPASATPAPLFTLPDQDGKMHSLADYRGSWVILYFYPKDDTPGCITEACSFREHMPIFTKIKAHIFGISVDSVKSHKKFVEKYTLPFTLLSDESKEVVNQYGVWAKKRLMGREYDGVLRTTFLIDPQGNIAKIHENVKPFGHAEELLADLGEKPKEFRR